MGFFLSMSTLPYSLSLGCCFVSWTGWPLEKVRTYYAGPQHASLYISSYLSIFKMNWFWTYFQLFLMVLELTEVLLPNLTYLDHRSLQLVMG